MYLPKTVAALAVGDQVRVVSTSGTEPEGRLERLPTPAQDDINVLIYVLNEGKTRRAVRAHKETVPWVDT